MWRSLCQTRTGHTVKPPRRARCRPSSVFDFPVGVQWPPGPAATGNSSHCGSLQQQARSLNALRAHSVTHVVDSLCGTAGRTHHCTFYQNMNIYINIFAATSKYRTHHLLQTLQAGDKMLFSRGVFGIMHYAQWKFGMKKIIIIMKQNKYGKIESGLLTLAVYDIIFFFFFLFSFFIKINHLLVYTYSESSRW